MVKHGLLLGLAMLLTAVTEGLACKAFVDFIKRTEKSKSHYIELSEPGCFKVDSMSPLVEDDSAFDMLGKQNTLEACRELCKTVRHGISKLVAMTKTACYCNRAFDHDGKAEPEMCNDMCSRYDRCGGRHHVTVYPAK